MHMIRYFVSLLRKGVWQFRRWAPSRKSLFEIFFSIFFLRFFFNREGGKWVFMSLGFVLVGNTYFCWIKLVVVDLGQVGRWERGTHQPRSGGESRRAVTWSDPSFPNPRTVSTVVESLLIILCLYCIYKCIRRPHNIWRCRTGFLPCARTVLVRCFVYFDNFSEVNFCVLCCSVREHTFGFDSCGVVGPRVSGMWTV